MTSTSDKSSKPHYKKTISKVCKNIWKHYSYTLPTILVCKTTSKMSHSLKLHRKSICFSLLPITGQSIQENTMKFSANRKQRSCKSIVSLRQKYTIPVSIRLEVTVTMTTAADVQLTSGILNSGSASTKTLPSHRRSSWNYYWSVLTTSCCNNWHTYINF